MSEGPNESRKAIVSNGAAGEPVIGFNQLAERLIADASETPFATDDRGFMIRLGKTIRSYSTTRPPLGAIPESLADVGKRLSPRSAVTALVLLA